MGHLNVASVGEHQNGFRENGGENGKTKKQQAGELTHVVSEILERNLLDLSGLFWFFFYFSLVG